MFAKVNKPKFSKLKLDLKGIYYISKIIKKSKIGDAAILKEIINILKKEGIKTISSTFFWELNFSEVIIQNISPIKTIKRY